MNQRRRVPVLVVLGVGIFFAGATGFGDTVILEPAKDATIFSEGNELANGSGSRIFAGATSGTGGAGSRRALIEFELGESIPAASVIDAVTLELTVQKVSRTPASAVLSLRRLEQDWSEGGTLTSQGQGRPAQTGDVTWSHRSFNSSDKWNKEGGDFVGISATATVSGTGTVSWSSSQMAVDVQMWLDDPSSNFGWILLGSESTVGSAKGFASSEGPSSFRPNLTIEYSPAVPDPPEIVEHPVSQFATVGSEVTFSVQTAGEVDTILWFKDDSALAGETAAELVLLEVPLADAGAYFVEVSNAGGTATSEVALLEVLPAPPEIVEHPVSRSATLGSEVTFSVQTAGEVDTIQWFKDGLTLAGETAAELVLLEVTLADAGTYFVEVSNMGGTATSEVALLEVLPVPPDIVEHPVSRSVTVGSEVTFSVQTAGEVDTIQWFKDGLALAGETAAELVLLDVTLGDAGTYFVEVSNTGGTATSEVALLEVLPSMEVLSIFEGAVDLGGGWRFVARFGTWNETLLPWIFHLEHGWQFVSESAADDGAWFFDLVLGWLFTSPDLYPNYFSTERNEWIFYFRDTADPRQFVSLEAGEFFQADVSGL